MSDENYPEFATAAEAHEWWQHPNAENSPVGYLGGIERRAMLVDLAKRNVPNGSVLELGCNVGANLNFLRRAGYWPLSGIDLNPDAIAILRRTQPDVAATLGPIEQWIRYVPDDSFDLIVTMAVLEHVHTDSEWIFAEMARIGRAIITVEDEVHLSHRHFPRNYQTIFEFLGFRQVEARDCDGIEALSADFMARVFVR